ncbi:unnamed protein product [Fraxinus pennsylvanica]|uniref:PUB 12/19-like N-terminal domain-containing protein n=1 Tax=Fraxinus pennsylvanica TaxID=56036 RepID=A0AAD2DNR1_9LAMI|nr:unnamed protein product [Fraxinus pennsylvanica]
MTDNSREAVLSQISDSVKAISGLPDCKTVAKKMYCNLVRMVKLLSPLFDELRDGEEEELGSDVVMGLDSLRIALDSALKVLKSVHEGRIFYSSSLNEELWT